jgi:NAD(P)-dependent dehydrogenase (short-subunit alcohol dehydrogenase family)
MTSTPSTEDRFAGRTAVVTGGTDGIGAATARALRDEGARVLVVGRSAAKAAALAAEPARGGGSIATVVADLGLTTEVRRAVGEVAARLGPIDHLVHSVGVLLTRAAHTAEGVEQDLAVSYLSRFLFLEEAARLGLLAPATRMVNIAASARRVPFYVRLEFDDLSVVRRRTGMAGHGQAQLANDLLTARAPERYGITAIGYGPGAVDTAIRREVPALARAVLRPLYSRATRRPSEVAAQLLDLLADPGLTPGAAVFADRSGTFPAAAYVADRRRQDALLAVSERLVADATARSTPPPTR